MRRWQELGMGVLGWSPAEFWGSSLFDLIPALDGFGEKNGAKKKRSPAEAGAALIAALRSHEKFRGDGENRQSGERGRQGLRPSAGSVSAARTP